MTVGIVITVGNYRPPNWAYCGNGLEHQQYIHGSFCVAKSAAESQFGWRGGPYAQRHVDVTPYLHPIFDRQQRCTINTC